MILSSWSEGWRRVLAAPVVIAAVFGVTVLLALPLAWTLRDAIERHLGRSLTAEAVADGVSYDWWQEFTAQASGLGAAFSPSIVGFAATLDNVSSVLGAQQETLPITAMLAGYLLVWTFLSGGILDRYARQRRTRAHGFFAASGVFLWRFLRLGLITGTAYWFLYAYVHGWLFDDLYNRMTRDLTVERQAFAWRTGLYAVFALLLAAVNVIADYTKIRIVVEDRRSALVALGAALRFVARHPGRVAGLYGLNTVTFLALVAVWALVAPGAGGAGPSMWLGLLIGQLYVLARLLLKLQFLASQTALFQRSLAHATYAAAPPASWPESPAAETIRAGTYI